MDQNNLVCCRLCLSFHSKHVSVMDDVTVLEQIKSCLAINITFTDDLPKDICLNCVSLLSEFYNFQQIARCSQEWLESEQDKMKKSLDTKTHVQPLPDSEYNSDSLLEFLNNNTNIEEYFTNLGKEDIPAIVNMLDKTSEHNIEMSKTKTKSIKQTSPKKKDIPKTKTCLKMDIDVLDSDVDIVEELLSKETEPKCKSNYSKSIDTTTCFACKAKFDTIQNLYQHLSICDNALRTCTHCNLLFDSKKKMKEHSLSHGILTQMTCNCGKQFTTKELLLQHYNNCRIDQTTMGVHYRCKQCSVTFKDRFQLYKHAKEHIIKEEERICDICGHTFIGNEMLSKHRKEEHEKPDNLMYRCKICNQTSTSHKEMYAHVLKHTRKQVVSRHLCESCGHSFASRATLQRHGLLHASTSGRHSLASKNANMKSSYKQFENNEIVMCDKCGQTVINNKLNFHTCG